MHTTTFEYEDHYTMKKNRLKVLEASNYVCKHCGGKAAVVHHKDGTKWNHAPENLLPVCHKCHMKIHVTENNGPRWDTELISVAMMQRGIDRGELAKKAGVTASTIGRLLKTGQTKNSTMKRIADVLEYPVEAFILPNAAKKLEKLEQKARTVNVIKMAIANKLKTVEDPVLHRRYHYWIAADIRKRFGLKSYFDVPEEKIDEVLELIEEWAERINHTWKADTEQSTNKNPAATGTEG